MEEKHTRSKTRISKAGRASGGAIYSRGALHHLLHNRIYLGEIVHRGQHFPGKHQPIVSRKLWSDVASGLTENDQARRLGNSTSTASVLAGKLFDPRGVRFTPTHTLKAGKRYRYYTSQSVIGSTGAKPKVARFPAQQLEDLVNSLVHDLLHSPDKFTRGIKDGETRDLAKERAKDLAEAWPKLGISNRQEMVNKTLIRVTVGDANMRVQIDKKKFVESILGQTAKPLASLSAGQDRLELTGEFRIVRRGCEIYLLPADEDSRTVTAVPSIVKAIARSRDWCEWIIAGEFRTVDQLATKLGLTNAYVRKILLCASVTTNHRSSGQW